MNHPAPELLLRHAEGGEVPVEVADHVAGCDECRAALSEIGRFETQLAAAAVLPAAERTALRAATVRLLAEGGTRRVSWSSRLGVAALALAAAVLATMTLWPRAHGLCDLAVHRYEPGNVVRAERLERFSLSVRVDAARWLGLWQLDGPAALRLLPHADPLLRWLGTTMPLVAGEHRLPGAEVLDFEFRAAAPPEALLLVTHTAELSPDELADIERTIAATPRAQLAAALQLRWPEARLVRFPGR